MWLQRVFFTCIVRPVILIVLGLHVRNRERLPSAGPAILVANHNSHLDTLVLMTVAPKSLLSRIRPVAAADYFLKNRFLAAFSRHIMNIIPLDRTHRDGQQAAFDEMSAALSRNEVLVIFPEGSRGDPEQFGTFKKGVWHLAHKHPGVPVIPVYMFGLGKALPRGEALLVPFICDVFVGSPIYATLTASEFMAELEKQLRRLCSECGRSAWV